MVNIAEVIKCWQRHEFQIVGWGSMQNFVIAGKAKTVFRLIELKAKQEEAARAGKKQGGKKQKRG